LIVTSTVLVSIGCGDNLDKFLSMLGAFACTPIAFTLPAWFHYRVCATTSWEKAVDLTIIIVSIFLMLFCTGFTAIHWNDEAIEPS